MQVKRQIKLYNLILLNFLKNFCTAFFYSFHQTNFSNHFRPKEKEFSYCLFLTKPTLKNHHFSQYFSYFQNLLISQNSEL